MTVNMTQASTASLWIEMEADISLAKRKDKNFLELSFKEGFSPFSTFFYLKIPDDAISIMFFAEEHPLKKCLFDGQKIESIIQDDGTYGEKELRGLKVCFLINKVFEEKIRLQIEAFSLARNAFNLILNTVFRDKKFDDYPTVGLPVIDIHNSFFKYDILFVNQNFDSQIFSLAA
jgi:hypothetical protein